MYAIWVFLVSQAKLNVSKCWSIQSEIGHLTVTGHLRFRKH